MHSNEVLQACQVDPIYCDIFGAAERVLRYGLPINLRYIFKRVPALEATQRRFRKQLWEQFAVYRLASFFAQQLHTAKQTKGFNLLSAEQICFGGLAPDLVEIYHLPVWTLLIIYPDVLSKIGGKDHVRGKDIVKVAWLGKLSCHYR